MERIYELALELYAIQYPGPKPTNAQLAALMVMNAAMSEGMKERHPIDYAVMLTILADGGTK